MRGVVLFVGAAGVGLLVVLTAGAAFVMGGFPFGFGACTEEERGVYAEFPQYGGVVREPTPFAESGGCAISYDTRSSQERVAGYYVERLEAHGWEVEQSTHQTTVPSKEMTLEEIEIGARRGDLFYSVSFSSLEYYIPPRPGVHVAVHVFENEDAPPPCGTEEKGVLAEFSHYGGREVGQDLATSSTRNRPQGYCATTYLVKGASEEQVLDLYEEELAEHGWKVQRFPTDRGGRLEGERDGLRYVVTYSRYPEERATDVSVEVYRAREAQAQTLAHPPTRR